MVVSLYRSKNSSETHYYCDHMIVQPGAEVHINPNFSENHVNGVSVPLAQDIRFTL